MLRRSGSVDAASAAIVLWQFIQTDVGGTAAKAAPSTVVWQYRQSEPHLARMDLMGRRHGLPRRVADVSGLRRSCRVEKEH